MVSLTKYGSKMPAAWQNLVTTFTLTERQQEQFLIYLDTLLVKNEDFNLTAIVQPEQVVSGHFYDSLMLDKYADLKAVHTLMDVGSGGGFPGIPLKILYPEMPVILLEVNKKKIDFLWQVIDLLQLDIVEVCDMDWRTFLRKTNWDINFFVSRASLHTEELMRALKPGSFYNKAQLVYWASKEWLPTKKEEPYFDHEITYTEGGKERKLIFFRRKQEIPT